MSRLKAKEEAVKFERGEDVLFREETEMGREVGGVGVKIEPGSTSEIPAVREKKKNHLDSRADGMNLEIYVVYQKLHQQRL